jgi:hypothetical protein
MEEREAVVRRGELELSPHACRICYGRGEYKCVHCNEDGSNALYQQSFFGCPACFGAGKHSCWRCGGKESRFGWEERYEAPGCVRSYEDKYESAYEATLRDVDLDGYRLQVWDTDEDQGPHHQKFAYRLTNPQGFVVFEAANLGHPRDDVTPGDELLRSLIGFLTLQPGDTYEEYFYRYTELQWEFANGDAEKLSFWAIEPEDRNPESVEDGDAVLFRDWPEPAEVSG